MSYAFGANILIGRKIQCLKYAIFFLHSIVECKNILLNNNIFLFINIDFKKFIFHHRIL